MMIRQILIIILLSSGLNTFSQDVNNFNPENSIQNKVVAARNSMDTLLYKHLFNWFLSHSDSKNKNKSKKAHFIYTPIMEVDEECFIGINCNYKDEKFIQCIKPAENTPQISALYSYDGFNWDIITFNGISWYLMNNNLVYTNNYSGIQINSISELKAYIGNDIFLLEGFYCRAIGNSIQVYLGNGKFGDFNDLFGPGKSHSARFAFGCK